MIPKLLPARFLDPRTHYESRKRPIAFAANIPLSQLGARAHELPPKSQTVLVAASPELTAETVSALTSLGRVAEPAPEFTYEICTTAQYRLWRPNAFLEENLAALMPATALDVACGAGRDATFMASLGWRVTAVDRLQDALGLASDLARRFAPTNQPRFQLLDARAPAIEMPEYDLVVSFFFLHRPLFDCLKQWVKPGGHLLIETFTTANREEFCKPRSDEHLLAPGELVDLLSGLSVLFYAEGKHEGRHTARAFAQKL